MLNLLYLLMVSHCLADFYLQKDNPSGENPRALGLILLHSCVYMVMMGIPLLMLGILPWYLSLLLAGSMGVFHLMIHVVSAVTVKRQLLSPRTEFWVFVANQAALVIALGIISILLKPYLVWPAWLANSKHLEVMMLLFKFIVAATICGKPVAVVIMKLLACFCAKPQETANDDYEGIETCETVPDGSGAIIGYLERGIILLLTFLQQYGVIGFVLTAKSVARYKQLEKQAFAEKYLIGTLSSTLIALLVGMVVFCVNVHLDRHRIPLSSL